MGASGYQTLVDYGGLWIYESLSIIVRAQETLPKVIVDPGNFTLDDLRPRIPDLNFVCGGLWISTSGDW